MVSTSEMDSSKKMVNWVGKKRCGRGKEKRGEREERGKRREGK